MDSMKPILNALDHGKPGLQDYSLQKHNTSSVRRPKWQVGTSTLL